MTPMPDLQARVDRRDDARYQGGPRGSVIRALLWHCTAGDSFAAARAWLDRRMRLPDGTQTKLPPSKRGSYHYGIEKDGSIIRTVDPKNVANHAGASAWPGLEQQHGSLNHCSIGIAFANDNGTDANPADDELTYEQLESGLWLGRTLMKRFAVPAEMNLGHREVSPGRKTDPLPRILDMALWRQQLGAPEWPERIRAT